MPLLNIPIVSVKPERRAAWAATMVLVATIALADFRGLGRGMPLGPLYLFPILIAALHLTRKETVGVALLCTFLRQALGPFAWDATSAVSGLLGFVAFSGSGLFAAELVERHRRRLEQQRQLDEQAQLRQDAEEQLRVLIETSPAAILIVNVEDRILLANEAARQLLGFGPESLTGESIARFLPPLASVSRTESGSRILRTTLECKGRRKSGEVFPAHVWLSTYTTVSGPKLAAIVLDTSEELRDREALGFDQIMTSSRILVRAVSHEIRNICAGIAVVHANLRRVPGIEASEDFKALGRLVEGLGKLVEGELRSASRKTAASVDLHEVLEELRIIMEPSFADEGAVLKLAIPEGLPRVAADPLGLLHIFMNLAANSQRALRQTERKELEITASIEGDKVVVRFVDSGSGVQDPERLFQPFRNTSSGVGIGLYLSRALARSFAGDLLFEARPIGSCFAVQLPAASQEAVVTAGA